MPYPGHCAERASALTMRAAALPIGLPRCLPAVQGAGCVYRHSLAFSRPAWAIALPIAPGIGLLGANRERNTRAMRDENALLRLTARVTAGLNPRVRGRGDSRPRSSVRVARRAPRAARRGRRRRRRGPRGASRRGRGETLQQAPHDCLAKKNTWCSDDFTITKKVIKTNY